MDMTHGCELHQPALARRARHTRDKLCIRVRQQIRRLELHLVRELFRLLLHREVPICIHARSAFKTDHEQQGPSRAAT